MKNDAKPMKMPSLRHPHPVNHLAVGSPKGICIPDQDVALLLDHHEVHTLILVLTHERMRDEVEEHIG